METEQQLQYQIQLIDEERNKQMLPEVYYSLGAASMKYRVLDAQKRPGTFVVICNEIVEFPTDSSMCEDMPEYNGWRATYEYPGYIQFSNPSTDLIVTVSSDFNGAGTLDVQVQTNDGAWVDDGRWGHSGGGILEWPYEGRTAAKMFALVKPFLDEYQNVNSRKAGVK